MLIISFIIMSPPLIGGGIKRCFCLTSVCLTSVAYIGPKSRTERPTKTKIGTEVGHVTRHSDTTFKVKRSKINLPGGGDISWRPPAYSLFVPLRWSMYRYRLRCVCLNSVDNIVVTVYCERRVLRVDCIENISVPMLLRSISTFTGSVPVYCSG